MRLVGVAAAVAVAATKRNNNICMTGVFMIVFLYGRRKKRIGRERIGRKKRA